MASVMSLAMMIFISVPVLAPSFGQAILLFAQWRGIFVVLMVYGLLALLWCAIRLPETLPEAERKSLTAARRALDAFRQTVTNRQTIGYALAAGGIQSALFAYVFSLAADLHRHLRPRPLFSARLRRHRHRHRRRGFPELAHSSAGSACA